MVPIAHAGAFYASSAAVSGANAPPWGHVQLNLWDNGEDTLVFMQGNEPISLYCSDETDGESLRACGQIVEALYSYDIDGNVRPQLATECTANEDLSLWTCSLRQGVTVPRRHDLRCQRRDRVVLGRVSTPRARSTRATVVSSSTTTTCGMA